MNKIVQLFVLVLGASALLSCMAKVEPSHASTKRVDASLSLSSVPYVSSTPPSISDITVATWNVEHLAFPIDTGCKPRTPADIEKLMAYVQTLGADVVALQEIGSLEAAAELFPSDQWQIVMSPRPDSKSYTCRGSENTSTQQKLAFAIKKSLKLNSITPIDDFGLDSSGLRYGLEIQIQSEFGELSLLNVHLKSGCFVDNLLRSDKEACATLAKQAPVLDNWIEQKEKLGTPYIILGDFNHRLTAPYNQLTQIITTDLTGERRSLVNSGADLIGCHPYYPAPIDHVFLGNFNFAAVEHQAKSHHFTDMQPDAMLSDHCALSTSISNVQRPLTNAVKWQTTSKEYQLITRGIYLQAQNRLSEMTLPNTSWVVVMDVDETILDNSAYQVNLDQTGTTFTPNSWDNWVKSQQATLVPGAAEFMQKVYKMGGKVALITNREKSLDDATWQNLSKLIPVTFENTCLTGRTQADKDAINPSNIINDKDLRRQQLTSGNMDCYSTQKKTTSWQSKHTIVMQIGDKIEDIDGITQEHADIDALSKRWNNDIFILLNPMYGSW